MTAPDIAATCLTEQAKSGQWQPGKIQLSVASERSFTVLRGRLPPQSWRWRRPAPELAAAIRGIGARLEGGGPPLLIWRLELSGSACWMRRKCPATLSCTRP